MLTEVVAILELNVWPVFFRDKVSGEREMLALYQAADVVLDTYPAGSYLTSLQVRSRFAALEKEEWVLLSKLKSCKLVSKRELISLYEQNNSPLCLHKAHPKRIRDAGWKTQAFWVSHSTLYEHIDCHMK